MFVRSLILSLMLAWAAVAGADVARLEAKPLSSPDGTYSANVEWDNQGFMGFLRMRIYSGDGDLLLTVELPEINPNPANLLWLDEEWVACESFLGTRGSGFFYVHVPTKRGYLVDIVAPGEKSDWLLNFTSNDRISTASIETISRDQSSLFPILMRELPMDGADYFTVEFAMALRAAVDSYLIFRRENKFREMEFVGKPTIREGVGALTLANVDNHPHMIYFPANTTTTQQMLQRTRLVKLDSERMSTEPAMIRWKSDAGDWEIFRGSTDGMTSATVLFNGKVENAIDPPFYGPTIRHLVTGTEPPGRPGSEKKPAMAGKVKVEDSKKKPAPAKKPAPKKSSGSSKKK